MMALAIVWQLFATASSMHLALYGDARSARFYPDNVARILGAVMAFFNLVVLGALLGTFQ